MPPPGDAEPARTPSQAGTGQAGAPALSQTGWKIINIIINFSHDAKFLRILKKNGNELPGK
jgi:hypothetical protein